MNQLFPTVDEKRSIFLPGEVMSSKNSKVIGFYALKPEETSSWYHKSENSAFHKIRPTLQNSSQAKEYIRAISPHIIENKNRFLELVKDLPKPYIIQLLFVRETRRSFDFSNMVQVVSDAMCGHYWKDHPKIPHVCTQWIKDDNMNEVVFIPPLAPPHYLVDAQRPGVWITPLDMRKATRESFLIDGKTGTELFSEL